MAARLSTSSALWYSLYETPPRGRIIKPKNISFDGDQVHGVESFPVMIGNTMWKWKTIELVNNLVELTMFYNTVNKCEEKYDKKPNDSTGETEKPLFIIIPTVLMEWVTKVPQILWELHGKIRLLLVGDAADTTQYTSSKPTQIKKGGVGTAHIQPNPVISSHQNHNQVALQPT